MTPAFSVLAVWMVLCSWAMFADMSDMQRGYVLACDALVFAVLAFTWRKEA